MKTSCEIIQDLIPLYSDGCASAESQRLVCEHLAECSECSAYVASYTRASKISAASDMNMGGVDIDIDLPYRNLAKKIRIRRRINTACAIGAVLVGALVLTFIGDRHEKGKEA